MHGNKSASAKVVEVNSSAVIINQNNDSPEPDATARADCVSMLLDTLHRWLRDLIGI